jgi:hypothetical protein
MSYRLDEAGWIRLRALPRCNAGALVSRAWCCCHDLSLPLFLRASLYHLPDVNMTTPEVPIEAASLIIPDTPRSNLASHKR